jgi:hypothetical protein
MPTRATITRARKARSAHKSASSQAGEFVHERIKRIRTGRHGARSARQAIAIGLSEARRAGVRVPAPKKGRASAATRRKAALDLRRGREHPVRSAKDVAPRRSAAAAKALRHEGDAAASHRALSRQSRSAARRRGKADLSRAARKAARTRALRSGQ